jgi:hypothetical protein
LIMVLSTRDTYNIFEIEENHKQLPAVIIIIIIILREDGL